MVVGFQVLASNVVQELEEHLNGSLGLIFGRYVDWSSTKENLCQLQPIVLCELHARLSLVIVL